MAPTYFTEDFWWTGGSVGTLEGRDTYQSVMRQFWTALPDARATEQDLWEIGDTVVFRDGKVAQQWAAGDWTAILAQIGEVTPPWERS